MELWRCQIRAPLALLTLRYKLQPSSCISRIRLGAGGPDDGPVLGDHGGWSFGDARFVLPVPYLPLVPIYSPLAAFPTFDLAPVAPTWLRFEVKTEFARGPDKKFGLPGS